MLRSFLKTLALTAGVAALAVRAKVFRNERSMGISLNGP